MSIRQDVWESPSGPPAQLFHLEQAGLVARVTNLGASLVGLDVPDRHGNVVDVVLQHPTPDGYRTNPSNFGATVGRFANRIAEGRFSIDDCEYRLEINNGPNNLHSGSSNIARLVWDSELTDDGVTFRVTSPDGDGGFPGNVQITVTYMLTSERELVIEYRAETDMPTVIGLTNHAYWNLAGHDSGSALGHEVQLYASRFLQSDENRLPTGGICNVNGTPFDFRRRQTVTWDWDRAGGVYDHCFVVDGVSFDEPDGLLRPAAVLTDPVSDRTMEISTTLPGVQFYTANHLDGSSGNAGYGHHAGLCLECEQLPAAPNYAHFPEAVLRPGQVWHHKTVHRFS